MLDYMIFNFGFFLDLFFCKECSKISIRKSLKGIMPLYCSPYCKHRANRIKSLSKPENYAKHAIARQKSARKNKEKTNEKKREKYHTDAEWRKKYWNLKKDQNI